MIWGIGVANTPEDADRLAAEELARVKRELTIHAWVKDGTIGVDILGSHDEFVHYLICNEVFVDTEAKAGKGKFPTEKFFARLSLGVMSLPKHKLRERYEASTHQFYTVHGDGTETVQPAELQPPRFYGTKFDG